MKQIVAIGGMSQGALESNRQIYRYLLEQSTAERPKVCFVPTASGESPERIISFFESFTELDCVPSWLSFFKLPTADLDDYLLSKDIIFVGGGNTRSMLALWREWQVDETLKRAYDQGLLLAGSSAGANCWFEECTTDSIPGDLTVMSCLGFLAGSFTPHYDVEPERKPTLHRSLLKDSIVPGFAADNDTALHFVDGKLHRSIRAREGATAYRVGTDGDRVIEEPLEMIEA